ncbi:prepilin-type N-terminal cleavage/methylation domain-containing protein [Patescibacteria group bacterium]|nr:prepilin-type N-terminal cleavage/methylation domain-containing protein [Patescibacteria group bacterium]
MKKSFNKKNKIVINPACKDSNYPAFTLVEMIVSLGIIMIISVIFIANYRSSNRRTDLIMTAQSLVADIHAAQNNSLGLVKYGAEVPAGGWGINFNKTTNTYTVFADLEAPLESGHLIFDVNNEGNKALGARQVILNGEIEIEELRVFSGTNGSIETTPNQANVTFLPPDPKTNIYNHDLLATGTALTVKLKEKNGEGLRTVKINFLGLIEMID